MVTPSWGPQDQRYVLFDFEVDPVPHVALPPLPFRLEAQSRPCFLAPKFKERSCASAAEVAEYCTKRYNSWAIRPVVYNDVSITTVNVIGVEPGVQLILHLQEDREVLLNHQEVEDRQIHSHREDQAPAPETGILEQTNKISDRL